MKRALIAATALALTGLTACATPTVYQPAAGKTTSVGFQDYQIETGRYRVTFTGGGGAPLNTVADYALLRAAEVALRDGYDWFRVIDARDSQVGGGYGGGPQVSVGAGGSNWNGGYGGGSSVGLGVGTSFDLSGGPAYSRTIEVLAGKGPKPGDGNVYDAREVVRMVGRGGAPA